MMEESMLIPERGMDEVGEEPEWSVLQISLDRAKKQPFLW